MCLPRFIVHPNGIILRVFKRPTTILKQSIVPRHKTAHELSLYLQQYSNELLNELLSETLPPKGLIELSVERKVDESALSLTKKSSGTVSLKDLNHNFENNVNSHLNQRLADAKQRSTENAYRVLSAIRMELYYVFSNKNIIPPTKREGALLLRMTKEKEAELLTGLQIHQRLWLNFLNESILDIEMKTETAKQHLPRFISYPN